MVRTGSTDCDMEIEMGYDRRLGTWNPGHLKERLFAATPFFWNQFPSKWRWCCLHLHPRLLISNLIEDDCERNPPTWYVTRRPVYSCWLATACDAIGTFVVPATTGELEALGLSGAGLLGALAFGGRWHPE